jgi:hypothetical protein
MAPRPFCRCLVVPAPELELREVKARGRTFTFALPYGNHPNYAWLGLGNARTVQIIRAAFAELSRLSGAKFIETAKTSKANVRVYFQNIANGGQYEGDGKIRFSNSRKGVTPAIGRAWLIHEVQHFLGYRASPPADKFHHSRIRAEIYHGDGGGTVFGAHFTNWLRGRYGV